MAWVGLVADQTIISMLERHFFPRWLQTLTTWLNTSPNYEQVSAPSNPLPAAASRCPLKKTESERLPNAKLGSRSSWHIRSIRMLTIEIFEKISVADTVRRQLSSGWISGLSSLNFNSSV